VTCDRLGVLFSPRKGVAAGVGSFEVCQVDGCTMCTRTAYYVEGGRDEFDADGPHAHARNLSLSPRPLAVYFFFPF
jgi:hypothetical protein